MSLITSGLGSKNFITLGLGGIYTSIEDDYISLEETTVVLGIENIVTPVERTVPLTGVYSVEEEINGWSWDKTLVQSSNYPESMYGTYLGGHEVGLTEGTIQDYWQSGTVRDIEYLNLKHFRDGSNFTWTPVVSTGSYAIFWQEMPLYSNYSFVTKINENEVLNELSFTKLLPEALESFITVSILTRDDEYVKRPHTVFKQVERFTGALGDGEEYRKETEDELGNIIVENICPRHREFLIKEIDGENHVLLNGKFSKEVGKFEGELTKDLVEELFESCGKGVESGRLLYTKYFPISDSSLKVIAAYNDGTLEELTEVNTLNFSGETDNHYVADKDLGIITIGGYQAPKLVLGSDISETDTEIYFVSDDIKTSSYSPKGVITIGTEKIAYYSKGEKGFFECIRGYDGTEAQAHSKFSIIEDIIHGKKYSDECSFYISYVAVPRVQYEVTDSNIRYANKTTFLDLRPIKNTVANKIVQISTIEKHVASIVLETDLSLVGGDLYGDLYYGTDFTQLCATVYDSYGNVVEDVETTIVIEDPIGYLNGTVREYTADTNSAGQICAVYSVPYDWNSISTKIKDVYHDGLDTIMEISERPPGISLENITLFQVLKHDPILGTVGKKFTCLNGVEVESSHLPYNSFEIEGFVEFPVDKYEDGFVDILINTGSSVIKYRREIFQTYPIYDSSGGVQGAKVILKENIPGISAVGALSYCWLFEKEAREWNPLFLDGVNVLVYEWKEDVVHPITKNLGAYYPLTPDVAESKRLIFKNRNLPIPEPYNVENNLGGYLAVMPDSVRAHAYARDPVTGRLITSNSIRIRLDLPAYLRGVDKSNPALPIPYGFTFVTEDFNVGSGIGGANFITINPKAEGVSSYSLFITPVSRGH